jgi:WD40 repeat protein
MLDIENENSLQELAWVIETSQGEFSLILARCNAVNLRQEVILRLQESTSIKFDEIAVEPTTTQLYQTISGLICPQRCQTLFVSGLESVNGIKRLLNSANQVREEFRKNFNFPVIFWVTDEVVQKFMREAPDLHSWSITVEFTLSTDQLINFIQTTADEVFEKVLEAGSGRFVDNATLNLQVGSSRRQELESAWYELQKRRIKLNPEVEAGLEFVLGRDVHALMEESRSHYERSLVLLQQQTDEEQERKRDIEPTPHFPIPPNPLLLIRQGCLLYCLGLWWRTYAVLHRNQYKFACEKAKDYFQQCIQVFEQANRIDLVSKFINALGGVLQRLEGWDELEIVAYKALDLHLQCNEDFKLARVYGFLAEVRLHKSEFVPARKSAKKALEILNHAKNTVSDSASAELKADLDWEMSYHQGWYLYALGRALYALGELEDAIAILETARNDTKPQYDPQLYIGILGKLRDSYFKQGEYLVAFSIKQEQRSIQQQYGFRAFIGAGRLQPKQEITNPGLVLVEQSGNIAPEITASGRQEDIENLCKRLGRHDYKLTVIHGQSGVGKSSILQAGLVPALKRKSIATRDVMPVLMQVYTGWMVEFAKRFQETLIDTGNWSCELGSFSQIPTTESYGDKSAISFVEGEMQIERPSLIPNIEAQQQANEALLAGDDFGMKHILEHLKMCVEHNLLVVLIFDQLEEFFVIHQDPRMRRIFYKFIRDCLEIPYVKIILSLREDYLHYLLECNNRLINFDVISNSILDNKILYHLGNFTKKYANQFLQSLNKKTQLVLEKSLIEALLKDLSRDLGEIRPIELQVVGTQLETEGINSLEKYYEFGPKEKLVERFLEEVIKDCGEENESAARIILYLLTDDNGMRPLKTKAELTRDLETADLISEIVKLDIALEILVRSNLILKIPDDPTDCYQIVHDYLVAFIRQSQQAIEIEESKREKQRRKRAEEKRRYAEAKLNISLKRQRNTAVLGSIIIGCLTIGSIVFGAQTYNQKKQAELANIQGLNSASEALFLLDNRLDALIDSLKATRQLDNTEVPQKIKNQTEASLRQAIYGVQEKNRLLSHKNEVLGVKFSPDGKTIASASADGTVKLWNQQGKLLNTLRNHSSIVTDIAFSPDGKTIASASADGTVKLWNSQGKLIQTLKENKPKLAAVLAIDISPDGQTIATANDDKTVKIWNREGKIIKSWEAHKDKILDIHFSPNGKAIASSGTDTEVKLWNRNGQLIKTFIGHKDWVYSINFSPDGKTLASVGGGSDRTLKLWQIADGKLLHNITAHNNSIKSVVFSPDGKTIATVSDDKTLKLWQIDGSLINTFKGHKSDLNDVSFSPNSQIIATAGGDKKIKLWVHESLLQQTIPAHQQELVWSVAFSPDGQIIASASADKTVKLWNRNGQYLKTLKGHQDWVWDVKFSPDGKTIATASEDKTVRLWNRDGKLLKILSHQDWVYGISFSPNNQAIASASMDGTVKIWNRDGKMLRNLKSKNGERFSDVSFSPNSQTIAATTTDGKILMWNHHNGKLIKTLTGEDDRFTSINFSPNNQFIIAGSHNNRLVMWNLKTDTKKFLEGHQNKVRNVAFSPDNQIIASASDDRTIRLWSHEGILLKTLENDLGAAYSVTFSPDNKTLASTSDNGTIKLWNLTTIKPKPPNQKELFTHGCNWVHDYLKYSTEVAKNDKNICD